MNRLLVVTALAVLGACGGTEPVQTGSTSSTSGAGGRGPTGGAGGAEPASSSSSSGGSGGSTTTSSSSSAAASSSTSSGSGGSSSSSSGGSSSGGVTSALLRPANPLPCADPAVFSEQDAKQTYYVYCTGMGHVWKTTDWVHFTNVKSQVTFDLEGMGTNGQKTGQWWAPGIVYAPGLAAYVMWVSVANENATPGVSPPDMRDLAVLTAPNPIGPWTYQGKAATAKATGAHYIDPFLLRDHDGGHYVFWKQYGGGLSSSIMGSHVSADWKQLTGTAVEVMNGYGGTGTWEDNVRENPAVWYDPVKGHHHILFSGAHYADDSYATGHWVSGCGPLCVSGTGQWHEVVSGDRGVVQVVQARNDPNFASGGPGGAVFQDDDVKFIIYAASAQSAQGDGTRYLMRDAVSWQNDAPFVDTAHHRPEGL